MKIVHPRIRSVKPEWRTDRRMKRAGHEGRILSIVLLTLCDDEGRGLWDPKVMAAEAFGDDRDDVASLSRGVESLSGWYLQTYEVEGEGYFQIVNFKRHQKVDKPRTSVLPPPPNSQETAEKPQIATPSREPRETSREPPDVSPTGSPISDLGSRISDRGEAPPVARRDPMWESTATTASRDGETVRRAVEAACVVVRMAPPREIADLDGRPWIEIGRWCRARAALDTSTLETVAPALAKRWAETPRTAKKPHPIAWLAANPDEYWRRAPAEPELGGGETTEDLIADLKRKRTA